MMGLMFTRVFIGTFLALLFFLPPVFAQENSSSSGVIMIPPTPDTSYSYPLPYPGILPDNPLYSLKMVRDKIILFLITDPYKKAQFNLLQADKRLQAGVFLIQSDKKKAELAISTISKGENYFHEAVIQVLAMKREGRDVTAFLGDLDHAASKHIEVLMNMKKDLPDKQGDIDQLIRQLKIYQTQVVSVKQ